MKAKNILMAIFIERHKTVQALVFRTISKNYSKEVILEVTKNFLAYGFCFVLFAIINSTCSSLAFIITAKNF